MSTSRMPCPRSFPDGWDIRSTIEDQSLNLVEYALDYR